MVKIHRNLGDPGEGGHKLAHLISYPGSLQCQWQLWERDKDESATGPALRGLTV